MIWNIPSPPGSQLSGRPPFVCVLAISVVPPLRFAQGARYSVILCSWAQPEAAGEDASERQRRRQAHTRFPIPHLVGRWTRATAGMGSPALLPSTCVLLISGRRSCFTLCFVASCSHRCLQLQVRWTSEHRRWHCLAFGKASYQRSIFTGYNMGPGNIILRLGFMRRGNPGYLRA